MSLAFVLDGPGASPVVVLSSSIGTTWELWDDQLGELTRRFRVLRYDHPGHGRSQAPAGRLTVQALAEGVVELLDRLELERVSFCGLSLGGMVGMTLALEAPERLDRLVLCCTAAYLGPPEGWHERARLVRDGRTEAVVERVLERWFSERFRAEHPEVAARYREMLEGQLSEGYARCCEAIAGWDARTTLGAIRTPTLVVAGAEDVATPPADGVFLSGAIPGAELVVLPDAAHLANVEQPGLFNRALLAHLAPALAEAAT